MNRIVRGTCRLAVCSLLLLLVMNAQDKPKESLSPGNSMSIWQARRAVVADLPVATKWRVFDPRTFAFEIDSFEFDATVQAARKAEHFKVDLKSLKPLYVKRTSHGIYLLQDEGGKDLPYPLGRVAFWPQSGAEAERLVAALNSLRALAEAIVDPLYTFEKQAAAWRALPSKPTLPERVRVQRLLAEDAVKQNKPGEALNRYEAGLELYPTWPQGRFNAALVAAELGFYMEAVEHMQAYLELVPDAPDAQAARDQIAIWQYKAKEMR